jgi:hypothetical protein
MSAEQNLGRQFEAPKPKQKRKMAYQYDNAGVTFCPSCHKDSEFVKRSVGSEKPNIEHNTDYQLGMLVTCSGGCGRTIYGKKGTYE